MDNGLLHNAVIGYWVILNVLIALGGVQGWVELRNVGRPRVALYLSRVMMAEALRAVITIIGIRRFHASLEAVPVYIGFSVLVSTLLCGAIWGWLLYTRGIINGGGVLGLVGRILNSPERSKMAMKDDDRKRPDDEKAEPADTTADNGDGGGEDDP